MDRMKKAKGRPSPRKHEIQTRSKFPQEYWNYDPLAIENAVWPLQTGHDTGELKVVKYPEEDFPQFHAKENFGIAISGGGTRAASLTLGWLSALNDCKLLAKAKYVSVNSGASWVTEPVVLKAGYEILHASDPANSSHTLDEESTLEDVDMEFQRAVRSVLGMAALKPIRRPASASASAASDAASTAIDDDQMSLSTPVETASSFFCSVFSFNSQPIDLEDVDVYEATSVDQLPPSMRLALTGNFMGNLVRNVCNDIFRDAPNGWEKAVTDIFFKSAGITYNPHYHDRALDPAVEYTNVFDGSKCQLKVVSVGPVFSRRIPWIIVNGATVEIKNSGTPFFMPFEFTPWYCGIPVNPKTVNADSGLNGGLVHRALFDAHFKTPPVVTIDSNGLRKCSSPETPAKFPVSNLSAISSSAVVEMYYESMYSGLGKMLRRYIDLFFSIKAEFNSPVLTMSAAALPASDIDVTGVLKSMRQGTPTIATMVTASPELFDSSLDVPSPSSSSSPTSPSPFSQGEKRVATCNDFTPLFGVSANSVDNKCRKVFNPAAWPVLLQALRAKRAAKEPVLHDMVLQVFDNPCCGVFASKFPKQVDPLTGKDIHVVRILFVVIDGSKSAAASGSPSPSASAAAESMSISSSFSSPLPPVPSVYTSSECTMTGNRIKFADGGSCDNTGILGLLRRGMSTVLSLVSANTDVGIDLYAADSSHEDDLSPSDDQDTETDGASSSTRKSKRVERKASRKKSKAEHDETKEKQAAEDEKMMAGYSDYTPLFGVSANPVDNRCRKVFDEAAWSVLLKALRAKRAAKVPVLHEMLLQVFDNPCCGVFASKFPKQMDPLTGNSFHAVRILFIVNARVESCPFVDWDHLEHSYMIGNVLDAKGVEQDFPYIAVGNLYYSQEAVDKMSALAYYSIAQPSEFRDLCKDMGGDTSVFEKNPMFQ